MQQAHTRILSFLKTKHAALLLFLVVIVLLAFLLRTRGLAWHSACTDLTNDPWPIMIMTMVSTLMSKSILHETAKTERKTSLYPVRVCVGISGASASGMPAV
jgi:hypothetical protein